MATQGGECVPFAADVTKEETLAAAMEAARARWGRIDILHNNVGVSIGGGDKPLDELSEEAFDRVCAINLRGTIMACKHVLPIMRLQRSGAIINISSVAARENSYPLVTYKATKVATQGGECVPFAADVPRKETLAAAMEAARARWGRIDILHNNVGVSIGGGDKPLDELSEEAFDRVCAINLRGHDHGLQARTADHAPSALRCHHQHFFRGCAREQLPPRHLQGDQSGNDRLYRAARSAKRSIRHSRQLHLARTHGYANGRRHARSGQQPQPRRGRCGARCQGSAAWPDGNSMGRRECSAVSRFRRSQLCRERLPHIISPARRIRRLHPAEHLGGYGALLRPPTRRYRRR